MDDRSGSKAVGDAGASGQGAAAQGTAGAGGHVSDTVARSVEGTMKEASDINTEETLSLLQSLVGKGGISMQDLMHALSLLNAKRTYDESQSNDLMARLGDLNQRQTLNNLATQALQNAIETANMVAKQAVRHSDIAIDNEWNPVQQGAGDTLTARAVSIDDASLKAIGATVAAAVANALAAK